MDPLVEREAVGKAAMSERDYGSRLQAAIGRDSKPRETPANVSTT